MMIISTKHVIYELPHELPNDLRNKEILRRSQILTELELSA